MAGGYATHRGKLVYYHEKSVESRRISDSPEHGEDTDFYARKQLADLLKDRRRPLRVKNNNRFN